MTLVWSTKDLWSLRRFSGPDSPVGRLELKGHRRTKHVKDNYDL